MHFFNRTLFLITFIHLQIVMLLKYDQTIVQKILEQTKI